MQNETSPAQEPRRRSRTRVALIEAAKRLLARNAINGFSIDDVAREADVARGTFYNQFASLDELVTVTVQTTQQDLLACVREADEGSPDVATRVARGVVASLLYCYRNPSNARVLVHNPAGAADPLAPRNELLASTLEQGQASGEFKFSNLDAAFAAVLGTCQVGTLRMLDVVHEYSAVRDLTHAMCTMVLRCLGVDARRIDKLARSAVQDYFEAPLGRQS